MAAPTKILTTRSNAPASLGTLNAATQAAIIALTVVLLAALYWALLYSPLADQLTSETRRRGTVESSLSTARTDERRYNDDVAELERLRQHSRDLARVLPDTADMPGFMRSINTLAEASGLQITLIQPDAEHPEQYYTRVPVRLEVKGSYLALARFFRAVSQLPRVINMENIALAAPVDDAGEVKLTATVLATTFRSLSAEEVAHAAAPAAAAGAAQPAAAGGRR